MRDFFRQASLTAGKALRTRLPARIASDFYRRILIGSVMLAAAAVCAPVFCAEAPHTASSTETGMADIDSRDRDTTFVLNGFTELEFFYNTAGSQEFSEAIKKKELRNRLELTYGSGQMSLYSASDIYVQPTFWESSGDKDYRYAETSGVERNLRISSEDAEIAFNELYLNFAARRVRLRIGNQIFAWGTADGINPTAYFNPYDLREFIFRDDDELRFGVPALSGLIFMGDYTLEMVVTPIHVPAALPAGGNYWSLQSDAPLFSLRFNDPDGMPVEWRNVGYGARLSTTVRGADASISAYHGPDRDPVLVPASIGRTPGQPLSVNIDQEYHVVDYIGVDCSKDFGDFVFQAEIAFSPNKRNIVEQSVPVYRIQLPYPVERSTYLSYAVGFNYFVPLHRFWDSHDGESVFTFEWFQAKFFDPDVAQPYFFTDLVTCRYEDTFYNGSIPVSVTTLIDTRSGSLILWPSIGWDFQNGWTFDLGYVDVRGRSSEDGLIDNPFYYYRDNDLLTVNLRYTY